MLVWGGAGGGAAVATPGACLDASWTAHARRILQACDPTSPAAAAATTRNATHTHTLPLPPAPQPSLQTIAHELGHNLYLSHSGSALSGQWDEYDDESCAMGYCCSYCCLNAPKAWQLGWNPVKELGSTAMKPGTTVSTSLFSQSLAIAAAALRVKVRRGPLPAIAMCDSAPAVIGRMSRPGL